MRCPHCGEPVRAGQETCFACGEKLRVQRFRRGQTLDIRIVILGIILVVLGLSGFFAVHLAGRKTVGKDDKKKPLKKVQVVQPSLTKTSDTLWQAVDKVEVERAREQLERLKKRYATVKSQVLGETPTAEQGELMAQIDRELSIFQRKIGEYASPITAQPRQLLRKELTAQPREINNLISRFSRAPKNR